MQNLDTEEQKPKQLLPHEQETLISTLNSENFYDISTDATKMFLIIVQYFK